MPDESGIDETQLIVDIQVALNVGIGIFKLNFRSKLEVRGFNSSCQGAYRLGQWHW